MTLVESNDEANNAVERASLLLDVLDEYIYNGSGHANVHVVETLRAVRETLTRASGHLDAVEIGLCKAASIAVRPVSPRGRRVRPQKRAVRRG